MDNKRLVQIIVALFLVYFSIRYIRVTLVAAPSFFKFQLTDLLFVPLMGNVAWLGTRLVKRDRELKLSPAYAYLLALMSMFYFEYYLPNYRSHVHPYTADWIDCLMYLFGAVLFHVQIEWKNKKTL